jgi:hypothetical protein
MPVRQTNSYTGNTVYRLLIQASVRCRASTCCGVSWNIVWPSSSILQSSSGQRLLPVQQSEAEMYGHKVGGGEKPSGSSGRLNLNSMASPITGGLMIVSSFAARIEAWGLNPAPRGISECNTGFPPHTARFLGRPLQPWPLHH